MESTKSLSKTDNQIARRDLTNIILIVVVWIVMAILVNPMGDFPLNDDWAYGKATQSIIEKGNFTLSEGNSATNLFLQAFWGALFCLPFGFSFSALRISTLFLGLIGVLATYGILRQVNATQQVALLGAFLIILNPIYFGLSNTFMTDIPFFALAAISLFFLIRGLRSEQQSDIIIGLILSYSSILIRQFGIMTHLAFGIAYLAKKGPKKINIIFALTQALLAIGLNYGYAKWLSLTHRSSVLLNLQQGHFVDILLHEKIKSIFYSLDFHTIDSLIYIGLFISPLLIPIFLKKMKTMSFSEKRMLAYLVPVFLILSLYRFIKSPALMPLDGNILTVFGIGPLTLHDASIVNGYKPAIPQVIQFFWIVLTIIGILSAIILSYYLVITLQNIIQAIGKKESFKSKWLQIFVILSILIYFAPLAFVGFFDRYLLLLIPLSMVVVIINEPIVSQSYSLNKRIFPILLSISLIFGIFTVGSTHDYLSLNRTRWQALDYLTKEQHISPHLIDGGNEFNSWYLFNPNDKYSNNFKPNPKKPKQSWWFVDKDDYMITFGPLNGYSILEKYTYDTWLPSSPKNIFILRKKEP